VLEALAAATAHAAAAAAAGRPTPDAVVSFIEHSLAPLAHATAGDADTGTAEWRARFAALHRDLRSVLAARATPPTSAARLSAAYAALVRAWLPRFGAGAAAPGRDARLLRGLKRALRDRRQPLPLLPVDAAAVLKTAAEALTHDGGAAAALPSSPFADDTARSLGAHAADDTALALADQVLAVAVAGGVDLDRGLRKRLFGYACRGLRESLRGVLGSDDAAAGGGAGAARAADGPRLPSPSFVRATATLAADLAIGLDAPPPKSAAGTPPRPAAAAPHLATACDLVLEAMEASLATVWQAGDDTATGGRALALAGALARAAPPLLVAAAERGVDASLDAAERVHALMRSAARLADEVAGEGGGDGAPWTWDVVGAPPRAPGRALHPLDPSEDLTDALSSALTAALAAAWSAGPSGRDAVKAALVPLADLDAGGGASPAEQQAELLTAGRLAARLAGDADLLSVAVPLLSESGVAGAAPAARAAAAHVSACLAALAARSGASWAYDAQVDALTKAYRAPGGVGRPLLHGGDPDSPAAGSLAAALVTLAIGLNGAPPAARRDALVRLLALFADAGAAARSDGDVADLAALLPAIAAVADAVWLDQEQVGAEAMWTDAEATPAAKAGKGVGKAGPPPPPPSFLHHASDADMVKAFRLLWLYVGVHGLAGVVGRSDCAATASASATLASCGAIAAVTPQLAVLGEGESAKLVAELGARVDRLGAAVAARAAAAIARLVGAPPPGAPYLGPGEPATRTLHVLSVACLELARSELAPLGSCVVAVADGRGATPASPLDALLEACQDAEPGLWASGWWAAVADAAAVAYVRRLAVEGRTVAERAPAPTAPRVRPRSASPTRATKKAPPSSSIAKDAVTPALEQLVTSLVSASARGGGAPTAPGAPARTLAAVLAAFPSLYWRPALLQAALASVDSQEAARVRAAAGATGGGNGADAHPGLALATRVVANAASVAPLHAEALLHEPLRGGAVMAGAARPADAATPLPPLHQPPPPVPAALRHAAALMAAVDAARPCRVEVGGGAGPIAGVEALSRKSYYGGAAGARAAAGPGGLARAVADLRTALDAHAPLADVGDRVLATAAALATAPSDPAAPSALRTLASVPARRLRPGAVRVASLAWAWVAAAAPALRVALAAAVAAAWLATVDAQAGLFSRSFDVDAFHMGAGGDPDDHAELTAGVRAHAAWLGYWDELWHLSRDGVGADADAMRRILSRLLHRSLDSARGLTMHPAAGGARARLSRLALLHAASAPGAGEPSLAASLLAQRALRASLLWFEGPPAWYGRWTAGEARAEWAAARDLQAAVAAGGWPADGLVTAGDASDAPHPVWGSGAASAADRAALLSLLLASEVERTATWADPLAVAPKPLSPYSRMTSASWAAVARSAWGVSPRLALALRDRLPTPPALEKELAAMVVEFADDPELQAVPAAASLLALHGGGDRGEAGRGRRGRLAPTPTISLPTDALALWTPAPLLQALATLGGPAGAAPAVRAYALRSLEACPPADVAAFLPQLVQLLRGDGDGQIAAYLLAAATRSVLYAHILICTLSAEGKPPEEAFSPAVKRSGWKPPQDTGLWAAADALKARVWSAMPADKLARLRAELAYFDAVTAVSGALYPVPRDERKNEAVKLVREIALPRRDLYLPTNPDARVLGAVPESAAPMQSAAKVPILVAFKVELDKARGGDDGGGGGGGDRDPDDARPATIVTTTTTQALIFKVGDDCRQDVLALQVVKLLQAALLKAGVDLYLAPYGVIPTGYECGIIEVVPDCRSRSALGETADGGLFEIWRREFGAPGSPRFEAARRNFIVSHAG